MSIIMTLNDVSFKVIYARRSGARCNNSGWTVTVITDACNSGMLVVDGYSFQFYSYIYI
jgi:hypothetical protein